MWSSIEAVDEFDDNDDTRGDSLSFLSSIFFSFSVTSNEHHKRHHERGSSDEHIRVLCDAVAHNGSVPLQLFCNPFVGALHKVTPQDNRLAFHQRRFW